MAANDWAPVKTATIATTPGIFGGWSDPLSEMSVPIQPGIFGGWSDPLSEMSVLVKPSEVIVAGWKKISETTVKLEPPTIECSTDADCPEGYVCENGVCVKKEGAFPWTWIIIGGAAAGVILIASGIAKKRKSSAL